MAMIAVQLVLEQLAFFIAQETQLLGSLRGGIEQLQDDLLGMKSFLQDGEARSESDQGLKTWVKQVRDMAYDAEDLLEEFLLHSSPSHQHGFLHSLLRCHHFIPRWRAQHNLAVRIQSLRDRVKAISDRRTAFSQNAETSSNVSATKWHDPRLASLYIDESDIVGIENPKSQLVEWLIEEEEKLTSISVVGMGGLGKTTLVKRVYDNYSVRRKFDCHSWVTISKSYTPVELLRDALKGFLEATKEPAPEGMDLMTSFQLVDALRKHLQQKRYVIVLDDIWSIDAWEAIKYAFPDCKCGSRIIFTTRFSDIGSSVENISHVYNLQPLSKKDAWTLFCAKAFKGNQNACNEELEMIARSILKKCEGLPLAIVAIGGLLSKKNEKLLEWRKVHDRLATELKNENGLRKLGRILLLSYDDLPYHLKQCFLYLSVFPEDYLIKRMKLIRLWTIERFVEEKQGLTKEEVAEEYLYELVSRSMIQVVEMDDSGRVRTCRVHDLMREIIQLKAREDSLIVIINEQNINMKEKIRRLSIHEGCKNFLSDMRFPYARSLLLFISSDSFFSSRHASFQGFKLLRILELEGVNISTFPVELVELTQLRYLSLRRTMIKDLPDSIKKLKNLEILDLKGSLVSFLPAGILQLKSIGQIRVYSYKFRSSSLFADTFGIKVPSRIGALTSLEKLSSVDVEDDHKIVAELGKLTQLRRLSVLKLRKEYGKDLCHTLERMKCLTTLYMEPINESEVFHLDFISSPPENLQRLYLKCGLTSLPGWITSLQYLSKLVLQYSNLKTDPLQALQNMPSLVELELRQAYGGEGLCCDAGGYPRLKKLSVCLLNRLQQISLAEGSMAGLTRLELVACDRLEKIPTGIEHLKNIKEMLLFDMPTKLVKSIERSQGEDFWRVEHISAITRIYEKKGRRVTELS